MAETTSTPASEEELQELVAQADTGAREPDSAVASRVLVYVAFLWSLFQLWYASPLPFVTGILNVADAQARALHLGFATFLAFLAFPALKHSPRSRIPVQDWVLAIIGAFCATYRFWFYEALASRPGLPTDLDIFVSAIGLVLLLEATRRSLGPPLMAVALIFMGYTFFGNAAWVPDVIKYQGASLNRAMDQYWLSDQGVFGIAIGVSTKFVFLFVLFGALLEKAGAGNYFIKVAFSLLGHLRGGPAKAAVVASGMTGLISGSSIANTVTTGTFTIPLMKRVGFSSEKGGAVEVASSVNGQIMPPVMGAAAFLMVEYVGISYLEVIKHAFLPAIISYIALLYIVHLEALKAGMQGLDKPRKALPVKWALISFGFTVCSILIIAGVLYFVFNALTDISAPAWGLLAVILAFIIEALFFSSLRARLPADRKAHFVSVGAIVLCNVVLGAVALFFGMELIRDIFGEATKWVIPFFIAGVYLILVWYGARFPELELDDPNAPIIHLPETAPTVKSGLHFILPIVVLVWCLIVERLSPGLSAFWATTLMIGIVLTQRPLFSLLRKDGQPLGSTFVQGGVELFDGMVAGARNMIGIGIATATAGIIVGTVTLTGIGLVMSNFVEFLSGGSLIIMLLLVAVLSLILGMGLPTTANYIVVSSLMAPVIVSLGSESGLVVPLIAVHLFVFYFGIMADVTPPVGLASFAAAAVSGGDPIRTGFQAFYYSLRTAALPFIFIFNTQLILYDVAGPVSLILTIVSAVLAMLVFAAGTQGYFVTRSRIYESALLLLVAFTLFRPGFWMDMISPPTEARPASELIQLAEEAPADGMLTAIIQRESYDGMVFQVNAVLMLGAEGPGEERLLRAGIDRVEIAGEEVRGEAAFGGALDNPDDFPELLIQGIQVPVSQPPKELLWIPALLLLAAVYALQRGRARRQEALSPVAGEAS